MPDDKQKRVMLASAALLVLLLVTVIGSWMLLRWYEGDNGTTIVILPGSGPPGQPGANPSRPTTRSAARRLALGAQALLAARNAPGASPTSQPADTMDLLVVDSATKQPIAGMGVISGFAKQRTRGLTGPDGHVFVPLPTTQYSNFNVAVRGRKYVPKRFQLYNAKTPIPARYTMEMEKGGAIGGKVVDERGNPIANAAVEVSIDKGYDTPNEYYDGNGAAGYRTIQTGADGTWTEPGAPPDSQAIQIGVSAPGYLSADPGLTQYKDPSKLFDQTATFTLGHGVTINGTVVGPDEKGIGNATVYVGDGARSFGGPPAPVTDAMGRFSVTMLPGQEGVLTIVAAGFAPEMKVFSVQSTPPGVTISLSAGHRLAVKIVDPTSRPVQGAYLFISSWRGRSTLNRAFSSDPAGEAVWNDAPADEVHYSVQDRQYMGVNDVALTAGDKETIITLRPPVHVVGTITDADTGQPIDGVRLSLGIFIGQDQPIFWAGVVPAPSGKFDFKDSASRNPGIEFRAEAKGYETSLSRVIKSDEGDVTLEMKLTPVK